jgi:hypothetical protein
MTKAEDKATLDLQVALLALNTHLTNKSDIQGLTLLGKIVRELKKHCRFTKHSFSTMEKENR